MRDDDTFFFCAWADLYIHWFLKGAVIAWRSGVSFPKGAFLDIRYLHRIPSHARI